MYLKKRPIQKQKKNISYQTNKIWIHRVLSSGNECWIQWAWFTIAIRCSVNLCVKYGFQWWFDWCCALNMDDNDVFMMTSIELAWFSILWYKHIALATCLIQLTPRIDLRYWQNHYNLFIKSKHMFVTVMVSTYSNPRLFGQ